jgi:YebC/PmpR family DNA-binding regulatory protein
MSGHSKWSTIKRAKGIKDQARGQIFTKLSRNITIAAQQGGGDPNLNFSLRLAVDKAKVENLPSDKIERAIKKGTGELKDGAALVQVMYEGFGPGTSAILIQTQTDNTNRAITEVKNILNTRGGKITAEGGVSWQFSEKGIFLLSPQKFKESEKYGKEGEYVATDPEDMVLELMELPGVDDVQWDGEVVEVNSGRDEFSKVHQAIQGLGFKIEEAMLGWVAKETVKLSTEEEEKLAVLVEALEECDEVTNVWHNAQ